MSKLNLFETEDVIWESYQGKGYRFFYLARDVFILLILLIATWFATKSLTNSTTFKIMGGFLFLGSIYITVKQIQLILVKYLITNERVIIKRGWLNVRLTSINLVNILDT